MKRFAEKQQAWMKSGEGNGIIFPGRWGRENYQGKNRMTEVRIRGGSKQVGGKMGGRPGKLHISIERRVKTSQFVVNNGS